MTLRVVLLAVSIVIAGLMAGLLFGWQVSIIPGLKNVGDRSYISTMQSINVAIVNPFFVVPFMVTPLLLAGAAVLSYRTGRTRQAWLLAVAAATYLVGVLGVTVGGNVPLNDALDAFDLGAAQPDAIETQRADYEGPWNAWHVARTVASVIALAVATSAALVTEAE